MAEVRKTRPISWVKAALRDFSKFPEAAQAIWRSRCIGLDLEFEITLPFEGGAYRVVYAEILR